MNTPIIRLEIESMKHTMLCALSSRSAEMDEALKRAVEECCTPENINAIVKDAAVRAFESALKEEVKNFFGYGGNGRQAILEIVNSYLEELMQPFRRLDEQQ